MRAFPAQLYVMNLDGVRIARVRADDDVTATGLVWDDWGRIVPRTDPIAPARVTIELDVESQELANEIVAVLKRRMRDPK